MDDLLDGEGYWEGELVLVPKNLCVAVLSLLQHLHEEVQILPDTLIPAAVRLNNLLGEVVHDQDRGSS